MDVNDPSLQADGPCSIRLHVAGLGSSVISSDLVQIFSSLSKVLCVDLVRSKGRNFAYVTLEAASPNLKRIFSLYNGCTWKGGRLKLEKAREFYLDKLHREWAERDCLENIQTPTARSPFKPKVSSGFKIYIPKFRKVKTIPEKGLGKHKRSFERVEPLPYSRLQICNCEGHGATTSSNYQTRTGKASTVIHSDAKDAAIKTTVSKTSSECHNTCIEASGYRGRKGVVRAAGVDGKSGDGQSLNEADDVEVPASSISQGFSQSEAGDDDDTECEIEIDEPVMNITGFNQSYLGKGSMEAELWAAGGTKNQQQGVRVEGLRKQLMNPEPASNGNRPRKRVKPRPASNDDERRELGEAGDEVLQRVETHESQVFRNPQRSRNWVQKASWKSLVGETGRMTFSLGNLLEQNLASGSSST